jgi:hypothetical protein
VNHIQNERHRRIRGLRLAYRNQCFQFCLQGFEAWLQGLPTGL